MKKNQLLTTLLFLSFIFLFAESVEAQASVKRKLKRIPGVVSVEEIKNDAQFRSKFLVLFEQPVDHADPSAGTFQQRVFVFHKDFKVPVVLTTEGYAAEYAVKPEYIDEIAEYFKTNQIVAEHRYFGESAPDNSGWDALTAENAAADHHRIIQAFKTRYGDKWISTGVSKGGAAALFHRMFYIDDVDITVSYVAPLNFGVEDGRHESFIATNATHQHRSEIAAFQTRVLMERDSIMPLLEKYVAGNNLTFKLPLNELYDYMVLEYAFAFYQWGWTPGSIPDHNASWPELFMHLVRVSAPEYFALESYSSYLPFFVQAARELGYYGYSIKPYHDLMYIETTQGYLGRLFLPDSLVYEFDISISNRVQQFLETKDPKMIFIYGEWDPWSASSVIFDWREKQNMQKFVKPEGCHRTRISNLPEKQKSQVLEQLESWLKE